MTSTEIADELSPKKSGKTSIVIAIVIAFMGGAFGFGVTYLDMFDPFAVGHTGDASHAVEEPVLLDLNTYYPLDTLIVNVRSSSRFKHLRFTAQLEVADGHTEEIESLKPRIMDAMNTFLNALEAKDFEDPVAIIKLRSHLLRRVQIVTGPNRVSDLLIMEFVLQ